MRHALAPGCISFSLCESFLSLLVYIMAQMELSATSSKLCLLPTTISQPPRPDNEMKCVLPDRLKVRRQSRPLFYAAARGSEYLITILNSLNRCSSRYIEAQLLPTQISGALDCCERPQRGVVFTELQNQQWCMTMNNAQQCAKNNEKFAPSFQTYDI